MGRAVRLFVLSMLFVVCLSCAKSAQQQAVPNYEVSYQVGAFLNQDSAEKIIEQLKAAGFDASLEQANVDNVVFYRVLVRHIGPIVLTYQVGAFTELSHAEKLQSELLAKGMEASIENIEIHGVIYHRVYIQNQGGITEMISKLKNMGLGEPVFRTMRTL